MRNPQNNDMSEYNTVTTLSLNDDIVTHDSDNVIIYESESVRIPMTLSELSNDNSAESSDEEEEDEHQEISDDQKNIIHREYLLNDLNSRAQVVLIEEERLNRREHDISEREYNATSMNDYVAREEQISRREYEIARRINYINLRERRVSQYETSIYNAYG